MSATSLRFGFIVLLVCALTGAVPPAAAAQAAPGASAASVPRDAAAGANPFAPDVPEPGSVEAIASYTTGPEYLPATVSYVPDSDTVPSPGDLLGHLIGAPGELTPVAEVHRYFRALAGASPRVQVETLGTSWEGREILLAAVSSEENLRELPRYRDLTARLADPRRTDSQAVAALTEDGKLIYHLLGGLHSTETGPPEMLMELAYRLAVSEREEIRAIRDNVIVLITPVMEPDGRDRVVEWYYRHLRARGLSYREMRSFSSPPYWGHYVFHDNNRDGIQITQPLTRAVLDAYWKYHPQVVHDLHESVPLLYLATGHGPYSEAADPVTIGEWTAFAYHESAQLQALGLPGVWTWGFWDGWWPGYLFSLANNHNSVGRFYETFGNGMAETFKRDLSETRFAGSLITDTTWYRPWPPRKTVDWSLRNNTNYMQAAVLEALGYAAAHRKELLRNFWGKGERALRRGSTEAPFAWIFPAAQRDPARLAHLVDVLRTQGIEVHRLAAGFSAGDSSWAAGSYVVRMDQPYRNAALNFLQEQKFPANEPNPPYDDVAWTLPLLFGVEGARINDRRVLEAAMTPVTEAVAGEGSVRGEGPVYLLEDTGQTSLLRVRLRLAGHRVEAIEAGFAHGKRVVPAGSWIVHAPADTLAAVAAEFGLSLYTLKNIPAIARHDLDLPRLGVYHTWTSTQDCGWARYTLDQAGVPYTLLQDADLRRGGLRDRLDVILFPNTWGDFTRIVQGIDPKYGPLAYTSTAEYPSHGIPDASPDITGGMGFEGLIGLRDFVEAGGVLVTLANAGRVPVDAGMVREVSRANTSGINTPGSVLLAKVLRPDHPVAYGYLERTTVFRGNGPLFEVSPAHRSRAVIQFGLREPAEQVEERPVDGAGAESPTSSSAAKSEGGGAPDAYGSHESAPAQDDREADSSADKRLVLSGYVKGEGVVDGKPAILDVPTGEGHVILFAFNPLHRHLNQADFRYVYNAILNWNDLPGPSPE